ncbi:MAG: NAD(P)H-dependent oxidoreductase [Parachlamydiales bacterium]|nr:NAD(P)H-dependent oxidoreductase [Parachlamydiales bacterium]
MKRLLHIIATPREEESRTLQVSATFLEAFQEKHPDWLIDELDLSKEELPPLSAKSVSGKYVLLGGKDLYGSLKETWQEILQHIDRFKTADFFLISTPMWNFHIPYMLKHYIDLIVQPKYLFHYKKDGTTEGLVVGKKMVVITSRGGQYSGPLKSFDHQEPYLRAIFGFVGISDIDFINVEPMDMGEETRKQKIADAQKIARSMGSNA